MKIIRNLNLTTTEGFSIKNLEHFPSMEWGENGGTKADILFNGIKVATLYDEGNGGCANIDFDRSICKSKLLEIKIAAFNLLKRLDPTYFTKYDFMKNKKPSDLEGDDFLCMVNLFEEKYEDYKFAKKQFNNHFNSVAVLINDYERSYLSHPQIMTDNYVVSYLKSKGLEKKFPNYYVIDRRTDLSIL